eukprot:scaffold50542_cov46-Phaeocystis_antarctica.AAC.1
MTAPCTVAVSRQESPYGTNLMIEYEISKRDMCILAAVLTVDAEILTNKNTPTCSIIPNKYVDVPKIASAVDRHWQQPHPLAP